MRAFATKEPITLGMKPPLAAVTCTSFDVKPPLAPLLRVFLVFL
jgi:hypothetical protein